MVELQHIILCNKNFLIWIKAAILVRESNEALQNHIKILLKFYLGWKWKFKKGWRWKVFKLHGVSSDVDGSAVDTEFKKLPKVIESY